MSADLLKVAKYVVDIEAKLAEGARVYDKTHYIVEGQEMRDLRYAARRLRLHLEQEGIR